MSHKFLEVVTIDLCLIVMYQKNSLLDPINLSMLITTLGVQFELVSTPTVEQNDCELQV